MATNSLCAKLARLIALIACAVGCSGICVASEPIPASEITALQAELAQAGKEASSTQVRRSCKNVIRKAESLLDASPEAPNRFALTELIFKGCRRLLSLEPTPANRDALFDIAAKLRAAPDEYAESRLEADLMLSERDLSAADASTSERVKALRTIIEKYRGTAAERRSLVIGSLIAKKLQAFDLYEDIQERMAGGSLAGDHKSIAFRRKEHSLARQDVVFSGTYTTSDGAAINFPYDRMGHQYVLLIWSQESEGHATFFSKVKEQQERFPGRFETYSLNLDELPDAGSSVLRKAGVKGTALHLPGGRSSSAYLAYGLMDPMALLVNGQGYVVLQKGRALPWPGPRPAKGDRPADPGPGIGLFLDEARYLAQLRSLFIGDWLVESGEGKYGRPRGSALPDRDGGAGRPLPTELDAIQACFVLPPFRYRLTPEEELASYRKAEKLCAALIKKGANADGQWLARNARIVSLIGMWNIERDPKHLEEAVRESQVVLSMDLPAGSHLVARFCLAKDKLRQGGSDPRSLLEELAGKEPSASALAAAAIIAIEASAKDLYRDYRGRFLSKCSEDDSSLWIPLSFMRDRQHDYRLFCANPGRWGLTRKQRYYAKYVISGLWDFSEPKRDFEATLMGLDGKELSFPKENNGKMAGVIFAELPGDESSRAQLLDRVNRYADRFTTNDVPVTVAFLLDDTDAIKAAVAPDGKSYRTAVVPDGLKNPLARRLGILSADKIPNPYLVRGDGSLAWSISGLSYAIEWNTQVPAVIADAIAVNIEKVRTDRAFDALEKGEWKKALAFIDERVPPKMPEDSWTHDRYHGRALAHMGLKDLPAALVEIDAAIKQRKSKSRWGRQDDLGVAETFLVKAYVLRKLGRAEEAAEAQAIADEVTEWCKTAPYFTPPSYARGGIPVGVYTDLLKRVRLGLEKAETGK